MNITHIVWDITPRWPDWRPLYSRLYGRWPVVKHVWPCPHMYASPQSSLRSIAALQRAQLSRGRNHVSYLVPLLQVTKVHSRHILFPFSRFTCIRVLQSSHQTRVKPPAPECIIDPSWGWLALTEGSDSSSASSSTSSMWSAQLPAVTSTKVSLAGSLAGSMPEPTGFEDHQRSPGVDKRQTDGTCFVQVLYHAKKSHASEDRGEQKTSSSPTQPCLFRNTKRNSKLVLRGQLQFGNTNNTNRGC